VKPFLGAPVLVFCDPAHNNGQDHAPAVITRVWSDTCVNVRVIHDGPSVPGESRQDWLTSVTLHDSREAAEADHEAKWGHVDHEVSRFGAFWPPLPEYADELAEPLQM
jgi:hypothetical protein